MALLMFVAGAAAQQPPGKAAAASPPDAGTAASMDGSTGQNQPAQSIESLALFLGEWKADCKALATPYGPARSYKATATVRKELDGFWHALHYAEEKGRTLDGYWGYETATTRFVRMTVGSMGEWETGTARAFEGDAFVWQGQMQNLASVPTVPYRHSFTKIGDKEIRDNFEVQHGGKWISLSTCTFKK